MRVDKMEVAELLSRNKFNLDEEFAHIQVDKKICKSCAEKPCLVICPAELYQMEKDGEISFDYAGCLECGTCRLLCENKGIVQWQYSRGSFGISFRHG